MDCKLLHEEIAELARGRLDRKEEDRVRDHLQSCEDCSAYFSSMKETFTLLSTLDEVDPPPFLPGKIMGQIRKEMGRGKGLLETLFHTPSFKIPLQAAAMLCILIAAVFIFRSLKPQTGVKLPVKVSTRGKAAEPREHTGEVQKSLPASVEREKTFDEKADITRERKPQVLRKSKKSSREGRVAINSELQEAPARMGGAGKNQTPAPIDTQRGITLLVTDISLGEKEVKKLTTRMGMNILNRSLVTEGTIITIRGESNRADEFLVSLGRIGTLEREKGLSLFKDLSDTFEISILVKKETIPE